MQALLESILDEVRPLIGLGKVADYIPALADVPANQAMLFKTHLQSSLQSQLPSPSA